MQLFLCILASIGGIFLKIHFFIFKSFRWTQRKFCCDWSVNISIWPEEHCTFLSNSWFPGNGSFQNPSLAPSFLHAIYAGLHSNNNYEHFTCVTMYRLTVSQFPVEGFSWKVMFWIQRNFRIIKIENFEVGVWLYWNYTIWQIGV